MKPSFIEIQNFWAWADKFWGIFGQTISTHLGTVRPLSIFFIIQPLFLQRLGLEFELEFEPQRIT